MLTHGRNLIFFLVCGSTMGAIARHKVLNILYSERGLDMLLANDSCIKQWFILIRTDAGGWLSWPNEQILQDNQRERETVLTML